MALSIVISGVADPTKVPLAGSVTLTASKDASSYAWVVLSKPVGSTVLITNATNKSCSVQFSDEGSYLIQLTINAGTPLTETATCAPGVRDLETGERIPALGETTENTDWAQAAVDKILKRVTRMSDAGVYVGKGMTVIPAYKVVRIAGKTTIGADARVVPQVMIATATTVPNVSGTLGVVLSAADGSAVPEGQLSLLRIRHTGLLSLPSGGSLFTTNGPVFVSDDGTLSATPGTVIRQIGTVVYKNVGTDAFDIALSGSAGFPMLQG